MGRGLEKRLPRISAPTLIVWGARDRFIAPSYADVFARRVPDATLAIVPEAGHLAGLERPDVVADLLVRFGAAGPRAQVG